MGDDVAEAPAYGRDVGPSREATMLWIVLIVAAVLLASWWWVHLRGHHGAVDGRDIQRTREADEGRSGFWGGL